MPGFSSRSFLFLRRVLAKTAKVPGRGRTYLFVLIWMRTGSLLEREGFSIIGPQANDTNTTHSVHATSRSLLPLLSIPPFEGFHLPVLLS